MRRIRLWVDPKYLRRESNHPQITQITRPHSKPKGYDPPTHTKHRELHFVLVWFRVISWIVLLSKRCPDQELPVCYTDNAD